MSGTPESPKKTRQPNGSLEPPELLVDLAAKSAALAKQLFGVTDELADAFGSEIAQLMAAEWGGQSPYIPQGIAWKVSKLHQEVWDAFNGTNHNDLVRRFGISRVWVYRIVKRMRQADLAKRHGDLFQAADGPPSP